MSARHTVVFLPGGVLPAEPAYAALLGVLGERVDAVAKDLDVYAEDEPPPDFGLDTEAEGVLREADLRNFDRFHLVGYSAGGAAALTFAAHHAERLLSLALLEPAWAAGDDRTPEEDELLQRLLALKPLPPDQFMTAFVRLQLAEGVEAPKPPEGPPPPWMDKRPAGLRALFEAFDSSTLDVEAIRAFDRPVYFALGGRSNPDYYARIASGLAEIFPDFTLETFPSATTSIRRIGPNPNACPPPCWHSGCEPRTSVRDAAGPGTRYDRHRRQSPRGRTRTLSHHGDGVDRFAPARRGTWSGNRKGIR